MDLINSYSPHFSALEYYPLSKKCTTREQTHVVQDGCILYVGSERNLFKRTSACDIRNMGRNTINYMDAMSPGAKIEGLYSPTPITAYLKAISPIGMPFIKTFKRFIESGIREQAKPKLEGMLNTLSDCIEDEYLALNGHQKALDNGLRIGFSVRPAEHEPFKPQKLPAFYRDAKESQKVAFNMTMPFHFTVLNQPNVALDHEDPRPNWLGYQQDYGQISNIRRTVIEQCLRLGVVCKNSGERTGLSINDLLRVNHGAIGENNRNWLLVDSFIPKDEAPAVNTYLKLLRSAGKRVIQRGARIVKKRKLNDKH